MNTELLFQLYSIHSPSGSEKRMRKFLRRQARQCGAESIVTDEYGNLFITKGLSATYPCLAAHMDQVQQFHSKDFSVVQIADDIIGWSPKCHRQQGLGADDKNGIFICLECLRRFDVLKVAFFVGEETGCVGSSQCDLSFFSDCRFIIQPDRRGGNDLITSMFCGSVCSDEFINAIGADAFGYAEQSGSITDVGELVERGVGISCLNLSCGYYNAHSDNEYTVLSELEHCLGFVIHIVETCADVYPFHYSGYGGRGSAYGRYLQWHTPKILGDTYDEYMEEEDYETMRWLVGENPLVTFREVSTEWGASFHTRDIDILRYIYDDAVAYNQPDTPNDDWWGDDEVTGELVFETQKAS